ncbi:MAG: DUF6019 family protein [Clostridium celatum]|nr:hypothetical protein [Erysipelotrichaceae bacterium]MDU2123990.1 DUF6019 family protein [Clostridium celatum]MDU4980770.1 DUF6019 family protein [Clostridium celatum]
MWEELGISGGTAIIILIVVYFVIKWSVKNGIKEAYRDITGRKLSEDEVWTFSSKNNKHKDSNI